MPVNEDLISASTEKTRGHLGIVAAALSNGGLAAKSELALGDILVGAILAPLEAIDEGRNLLKAEPKVASWIGNLVKRPSFATTAV
ncbi:MAG: hypothetical protein AAF773_24170 [Cyanobacteria bacterium P01_D01_bin.115]